MSVDSNSSISTSNQNQTHIQTALSRRAIRIRHTFKQLYLDQQSESDTYSNSSISTSNQNQTHIQTALSRRAIRIRHIFKRLFSPSDHFCRPRYIFKRYGHAVALPLALPHGATSHNTLFHLHSFHTLNRSLTHCPRTPVPASASTHPIELSGAPVATEYYRYFSF